MRGQRVELAHPGGSWRARTRRALGGRGQGPAACQAGQSLVADGGEREQSGERVRHLLVPRQRWADSGRGQMQPQVPGVHQASARLLTLPSRGGTLPSLCLFPHLLPTNTRVVVKTEQGPWLGAWYRAPCLRTVVTLPQGLGGSRRSEGTPSIPPPAVEHPWVEAPLCPFPHRGLRNTG